MSMRSCRLAAWVNRLFPLAVALLAASASWSGASAYTLTTLRNFCTFRSCTDGQNPGTDLLMDAAGVLYGTTAQGGVYGWGIVYQLSRSPNTGKWAYRVLYNFCSQTGCSDGASPQGHLIVDTAGNLYGTTGNGGSAGRGIAFELIDNGGKKIRTLKVLYNFNSQSGDGYYPASGLTYVGAASGIPYDGVSPLFGTTTDGGAHAGGTAFELTNDGGSWSETIIYNFCSKVAGVCRDGRIPSAGMIVDGSGGLFGTAQLGGQYGHGIIFKLEEAAGSWTETVLHSFCAEANCADGQYPSGKLVMDGAGNLFGTMGSGGTANGGCCGFIYKLVPRGTLSPFSIAHEFCDKLNCLDGANPYGTLIVDSSGNLLGTTNTGGGHNTDGSHLGGGTVFSLSGSSLQTLYAFCARANCLDGKYPVAGLVMDPSGNLFGTTSAGGKFAAGTLFELTP